MVQTDMTYLLLCIGILDNMVGVYVAIMISTMNKKSVSKDIDVFSYLSNYTA